MKESSWDKLEQAELITSVVLFGTSLVGWPLSMLTWAKNVPDPTTLSLSWLALVYAAFTAVLVSLRNKRGKKDATTS